MDYHCHCCGLTLDDEDIADHIDQDNPDLPPECWICRAEHELDGPGDTYDLQ